MAEVGAVVAGVAGGAEVQPFQAREVEKLVGVGLAEDDVGIGEQRVGFSGAEDVGELRADEKVVGGDGGAETGEGGVGKGGVGPDV